MKVLQLQFWDWGESSDYQTLERINEFVGPFQNSDSEESILAIAKSIIPPSGRGIIELDDAFIVELADTDPRVRRVAPPPSWWG